MRLRFEGVKAIHDSVNGAWSRVCQPCFVRQPGYMDHEGQCRSRTALFLQFRQKTSDYVSLEVTRLEKRMEKLIQIHQAARRKNAFHFFIFGHANMLSSFNSLRIEDLHFIFSDYK
jgi:hypothetical protein